MSDNTSTYAALGFTLLAAHQLADHVLGQTDAQARTKGKPGREGWAALGRHVGMYHAVMGGMVAVTAQTVGLPVSGCGLAAGLAVSAGTHALWDRRWPVRWVLAHTGSAPFADLADHGMNGAYLADQALHVGCLWLAALVAVRASRGAR